MQFVAYFYYMNKSTEFKILYPIPYSTGLLCFIIKHRLFVKLIQVLFNHVCAILFFQKRFLGDFSIYCKDNNFRGWRVDKFGDLWGGGSIP